MDAGARPLGRVLLLAAVLTGLPCGASAARAAPPRPEDRRRPVSWRPVDAPWRHLRLDPRWTFYEASRGPAERFPYLVAARAKDRAAGAALAVRPENVATFLAGGVASEEAALELALFFVPGILLAREVHGSRLLGQARAHARQVTHFEARISALPERWSPRIQEIPADARGPGKLRWQFAVNAFEYQRRVRLARFAGRVGERGTLQLTATDVVVVPGLSVAALKALQRPPLTSEGSSRLREAWDILKGWPAAFAPRMSLQGFWALARDADLVPTPVSGIELGWEPRDHVLPRHARWSRTIWSLPGGTEIHAQAQGAGLAWVCWVEPPAVRPPAEPPGRVLYRRDAP